MLFNPKKSDKRGAFFAFSGIVEPVEYAIVWKVWGMLWEGKNPISQGMSELGAANAPLAFLWRVEYKFFVKSSV